MYFLGIDGGGTKTRCILGDEDSVLGKGSSSTCKVQRVGEACARDSLAAAVHEACVQAGISPRQIARTCAGITGSGRPEIASVMQDLIASVVGGEIEIVGDVEIAFEDAFGAGPGVIVIAGTGSIAYGRNSQGETMRVGGWGSAISDEGSGYWIGVEAVRSALREHDRGENSALLKNLSDALGTTTFEDFIVRVNANPAPEFAALFPSVLSAADTGDSLAHDVLESAGRELANAAESVIRRLFENPAVSVATHGGVLEHSLTIKNSFKHELQSLCPQASLLANAVDPARGALQRARRGVNSANA